MSFQTNQYKAITYGEALEQVQTLAGVLQSKGVKKGELGILCFPKFDSISLTPVSNLPHFSPGDTVVIYSPMCPEAAFSMLACARIGELKT